MFIIRKFLSIFRKCVILSLLVIGGMLQILSIYSLFIYMFNAIVKEVGKLFVVFDFF